MRTGRMADIDLGVLVHVTISNIKCFGRRRSFSGRFKIVLYQYVRQVFK
jgi:hypothetical protein